MDGNKHPYELHEEETLWKATLKAIDGCIAFASTAKSRS
jgi:hypothetical protein